MSEDRTQSIVRPRSSAADHFEQNPLQMVDERVSGQRRDDDEDRVREAVRRVVEDGAQLNEAALALHVAPSLVARWKKRYLDHLTHEEAPAAVPVRPLMEESAQPAEADLVALPLLARQRFAENWQHLVDSAHPAAADFQESALQYLLQTSSATRWLYQDGRLDRSVLSGVITVLLGVVLTAGFAISQRNSVSQVVNPPEHLTEIQQVAGASAVALEFLAAESPAAKASLCRDPERVVPLIEEHMRIHGGVTASDGSVNFGMAVDGIVNLQVESVSLGRPHSLCFVRKDGKFLLDWESSSFYQEELLRTICRTRPTTPVIVRVKVERDDYYNFAFADSARWRCFRLRYPGLDLELFGYCEQGSASEVILNAISSDPADSLPPAERAEEQAAQTEEITRLVDNREIGLSRPAVLEVKFPPDARANQVEIIQVISGEWVPLSR